VISLGSAAEFALLSLDGEFDLADAEALGEALGNLDSEPVIIVSLAHVAFLDSTILNVFFRANAAHAGNLVVVLPEGTRAKSTFALAGLEEQFRFAPSVNDAIAIARTLRDIVAASFSRDGTAASSSDEASE